MSEAPPFNALLEFRSADWLQRMLPREREALLTELLRRPPSALVWRALLELLLNWPASAQAFHPRAPTNGAGVPERATASESERATAIEQAERALAVWPDALRELSSSQRWFFTGRGESATLVDVAGLARVMIVYRREEEGSRELSMLARSPLASGLRRLVMTRSTCSSGAMAAFIASPWLRRLSSLNVVNCVLGEASISTVLNGAGLPGLEALRLAEVGLSRQRLERLGERCPYSALRSLGLVDDALGDTTLARLARSPWLEQVDHLELGGSFSAAGIEGLLAALPRSVTLTMTRTRLNTGERALLTAEAARLGHSLRFS